MKYIQSTLVPKLWLRVNFDQGHSLCCYNSYSKSCRFVNSFSYLDCLWGDDQMQEDEAQALKDKGRRAPRSTSLKGKGHQYDDRVSPKALKHVSPKQESFM